MALATDVVPFAEADLALLRTAVDPPGIAAFAEGTGSAVMGAGFLSGYPEQGMVSLSPLLTPVEILRHESQTPRGPAILVRGDVRKGNSGGRSEEHTSELQSLMRISYAVFCLKKKKNTQTNTYTARKRRNNE